jgi:putative phage-type endonuclease
MDAYAREHEEEQQPAGALSTAVGFPDMAVVAGNLLCRDAALDRLALPHLRPLFSRQCEGGLLEGLELGALEKAELAAVLSRVLGEHVPRGAVDARLRHISASRAQLLRLLAAGRGIEQRTAAWYAARQTMMTASDVAQALGHGKYGTARGFFEKKCGREDEQTPFESSMPPLKWGVMFEPAALAVYRARNGVRVHEFGLLRHPGVPNLGASPDGISELGVMLEIKCPYMRRITGQIPLQYYFQIQAQLEVCGLDLCDYLECAFEDYGSAAALVHALRMNEACDDLSAEDRDPWGWGCILEVVRPGQEAPQFAYPPAEDPGRTPRQAAAWADAETARILGSTRASSTGASVGVRQHWWRLARANTVRVRRCPEFVAEMLRRVEGAWAQVLRYRADRALYEADVLSKKRTRRPKGQPPDPQTPSPRASGLGTPSPRASGLGTPSPRASGLGTPSPRATPRGKAEYTFR